MHVRGKDMTYIAHLSRTARTEMLLRVPKYDFNWQITYELATPKLLPKGTKLEVDRALRQLAEQQVQPGSDEGRALGRSDLGRDDDRLLLDARRSARCQRRPSPQNYRIWNLEFGILHSEFIIPILHCRLRLAAATNAS